MSEQKRKGNASLGDYWPSIQRKQHLAAYKPPKMVYLAKDFPRTKNGKILRKDISPNIGIAQSSR